MKYLICNLKSNQTLKEATEYKEKIIKIDTEGINFVLCPTFTYLSLYQSENIKIGAQNVSEYDNGAYTGEVNAKQLKSCGINYVIVGHSERRKIFKENADAIKNKIKQAVKNGLKVIYCIGESEEQYLRQKTYVTIEKQITEIFGCLTNDCIKNIIIAYEPIWAIGTGKIPQNNEIEEITSFIKKVLSTHYHANMPVIYGGSIDDSNIKKLNKISNVDGFLVGGASLNIEKLKIIIEVTK